MPLGRPAKLSMTMKPHKPMRVQISLVLVCPCSMLPAASGPSQCLSGSSQSKKPARCSSVVATDPTGSPSRRFSPYSHSTPLFQLDAPGLDHFRPELVLALDQRG